MLRIKNLILSYLTTRFIVCMCTLISLLYLRSLEAAFFVFGGVVNAIFSKLLKKLFNHTRPNNSILTDPGMPSSHSQMLFYYCATLFTEVAWYEDMYQVERTPYSFKLRASALFLFCAYASASATWRIIEGYHTLLQVIVGAIFGVLFGFVYRLYIFNSIIRPLHQILGPYEPLWLQVILVVLMLIIAAIVVERSLQRSLKKMIHKVKSLSTSPKS